MERPVLGVVVGVLVGVESELLPPHPYKPKELVTIASDKSGYLVIIKHNIEKLVKRCKLIKVVNVGLS